MLCVAETKIDKLLNEIRLPKEKIREMLALGSKLMSNFMISVEFYLGDRVKNTFLTYNFTILLIRYLLVA